MCPERDFLLPPSPSTGQEEENGRMHVSQRHLSSSSSPFSPRYVWWPRLAQFTACELFVSLQIPVACKSCPCGFVFISRKLLNAKLNERSSPAIAGRPFFFFKSLYSCVCVCVCWVNFSTKNYNQDTSDDKNRWNVFSGRGNSAFFSHLALPRTTRCKKVDLQVATVVRLLQHSTLSELIFICS